MAGVSNVMSQHQLHTLFVLLADCCLLQPVIQAHEQYAALLHSDVVLAVQVEPRHL